MKFRIHNGDSSDSVDIGDALVAIKRITERFDVEPNALMEAI